MKSSSVKKVASLPSVTSDLEGHLRFLTSDAKFYYCDGATWTAIESGADPVSNGVKVYRALLTQSGDGTSTQIAGPLVVGKRYKITTYVSGDDFTNVGSASNAGDVEFTATGTTPTDWTNESELTDTGAPVATVLENTLGGVPVFTYITPGNYLMTLAGAFLENKVVLVKKPIETGSADEAPVYLNTYRISNDVLMLTIGNPDAGLSDNQLHKTFLEILVYP